MRWELRRALPLLLVTLSLALLPSNLNAPHGERNGPGQATFRVNDALEESFLGWEQPPNPNSTHHLIFNSVIGLLQRWSNTHRRNGAFIEPGSLRYADFLSCPKATAWCLRLSPQVQSCTTDVTTTKSRTCPSGSRLILNTPMCTARAPAT